MAYLIGVDIGTQGTKAALFSEQGRCLGRAFRPSRLFQPKAGVVEEDPERQVESVCQAIRASLRAARVDSGSVAAIGIDGQMAGIIGVGKDGRHVTPYDSWLDTRCTPYIRRMAAAGGDEVLRKTGCPPSINHGPKKLWWKHERPKIYRAVRAFVQPGGYAVMRLCGLDASAAFIDATYLHFSGFADNPRSAWDPGLCEMFSLDPAKLPRIVAPHAIAGEVAAAQAAACGLKPGVPVVAGCGDTAASFLACGATREGVCVDVAGTAAVFASTTREFRPDTAHRTLGCGQAAVPGLWHPYAYINGAGLDLEWFRREVANRGRKTGAAVLDFAALNRLASRTAPDDDAPVFLPHLGGRVCPSAPAMRGAWAGLTWTHTLGHLYRAVLEGVALEYGLYAAILRELYPKLRLKELRITGGGEKSPVWNRIKANVLGTPVVRIAQPEGAPMGAALVAGYGAGVFKDLGQAAAAWVREGARQEPDPGRKTYYEKRVMRYQGLMRALEDW